MIDDATAAAVETTDHKPLAWARTTLYTIDELSTDLSIKVTRASMAVNDVIESKRQEQVEQATAGFKLDDRVTVEGYAGPGTVRFIGANKVNGKPRLGIELDAPNGKGEGTFGGITYFKCPPFHGLLVHPCKVVSLAQ